LIVAPRPKKRADFSALKYWLRFRRSWLWCVVIAGYDDFGAALDPVITIIAAWNESFCTWVKKSMVLPRMSHSGQRQ